MSALLPFRYPPSPSSSDRVCYAALCDLGLGTGNAAVIDQRGGRRVAFKLDGNAVTLIRGVACVACESLGFADGVHHARLPDGKQVWVRDVRDVFDAAESYSTDDTAA